jgi:hypothetical protein
MPLTNLCKRIKGESATEPVVSFNSSLSQEQETSLMRITSAHANLPSLADKLPHSSGSQHPFSAIWRWRLVCTLKKRIASYE